MRRAPKITLSLDAPALTRGVGFFETLWVLDRRPVFFERHFARLASSCTALEVPPPSRESVRRAARGSLREARRGAEYAMRWSYLAVGRDLNDPRSWKLWSVLFPVPEEVLRRRGGVRAITLPRDWQRLTPRWKTIDYRASVAGLARARARRAQEAIFVDRRGRALEGTATNLFALSGRRLLTPSGRDAILPGVVRSWVVENAGRVGIRVAERAFSASRLRDGGFLTGSLTGLAPLLALDGVRCGSPGDAFRALRELYRDDAAAGRGDLAP